MNAAEILHMPSDELWFIVPPYLTKDHIDKRFEHLRVERRGLRFWASFEENPEFLQSSLQTLVQVPHGWTPQISSWDRFAGSEAMMLNLYHLTLIQRVNIALNAALPDTSLIGAAATISSYGTENDVEGENGRRIIPDLLAINGKPGSVDTLKSLTNMIIVAGDAKLKLSQPHEGDTRILPGTRACLESYLAQPVQYCIDLDIRFGFVLTNFELVLFQLVRQDSPPRDSPIKTRNSYPITSPSKLPSDHTDGGIFSSPIRGRKTGDWVRFWDGDEDIGPVTATNPSQGQQLHSSTPHRGSNAPTHKSNNSPPHLLLIVVPINPPFRDSLLRFQARTKR